jgi:hypothetical protein
MTLVVLALAWIGIAYGMSWMAISLKRELVRLWSVLLNGAAVDMK